MIRALLSRIPIMFWIGLAVAALATFALWALYDTGYTNGKAEIELQWDAERSRLNAQIAREKERQAQVVTRTVIEYRDRIQVVEKQGQEVIREVEKLVPMDSPVLSGAFRVLHDAAAGAQPLPADPGSAFAAAAPVEAASLLRTTADNYATCRAELVKLESLQNLVRDLQRKDSNASVP